MRTIILAIFYFLLSPISNGQTLICDSGVVLKKGIYRTFEEFRTNSPSLDTISFTVIDKNIGYGILNLEKHTSYRILLKNPKALSKKDSIWGFCDGTNIYYNQLGVYRKKNINDKLEYIGRYCMFDYIENRQTVTPMAGGGMYTTTNHRVKVTMAININNGLVFELNKKNLKKILSMDFSMQEDFKDETQKSRVLKQYLIDFSEAHKDKIKR